MPASFIQFFLIAALDLMKRMLTFNPQTRITMAEALMHPYFQQYDIVSSDLDKVCVF